MNARKVTEVWKEASQYRSLATSLRNFLWGEAGGMEPVWESTSPTQLDSRPGAGGIRRYQN